MDAIYRATSGRRFNRPDRGGCRYDRAGTEETGKKETSEKRESGGRDGRIRGRRKGTKEGGEGWKCTRSKKKKKEKRERERERWRSEDGWMDKGGSKKTASSGGKAAR